MQVYCQVIGGGTAERTERRMCIMLTLRAQNKVQLFFFQKTAAMYRIVLSSGRHFTSVHAIANMTPQLYASNFTLIR